MPLILHGDGTNTRRYLYAGDAVDALDTILHKGRIGEIYNVGSRDEISNADLSQKLLCEFDIPISTRPRWVQYVKDRPFNDKRYAVDATKLRSLGWEQKTSFDEGLKVTANWYRRFGRTWWDNIENVLTPFPELRCGEMYDEPDPTRPAATPSITPTSTPALEQIQQMQQGAGNSALPGVRTNGYLKVPETAMNSRKRPFESEEKENIDVDSHKRAALGDGLSEVRREIFR